MRAVRGVIKGYVFHGYMVVCVGGCGYVVYVIVCCVVSMAAEEIYVRSSAADALVRVVGEEAFVVVILVKHLHDDEDSFVRWSAAKALGKLGKDSDLVVNSLVKLLDDEDRFVRWSAANAIGQLRND